MRSNALYDRLARALIAAQQSCALCGEPVTDSQYEQFVDQLALALHDHNPHFKYSLWEDACEDGI